MSSGVPARPSGTMRPSTAACASGVVRGGVVKGFTQAIFSGLTTHALAAVLEDLLLRHRDASGIYHLSSSPISKHDLLVRFNDALGLGITIVPDDDFHCDRSLDSTRFRQAFGYVPPSWDDMISDLKDWVPSVSIHAR